MQLNKLLDFERPDKYIVTNEFYNNEYKTPVLTAGKSFILGYTDDRDGIYKASDSPIILFDDFTTATQWVDFDFKVKSSACKILKARKGVNLKYVYYAMQRISFDASQHMRYWIKSYSNIEINYPSKEMIDTVVKVLDSINSLITNEKKELNHDLLRCLVKKLLTILQYVSLKIYARELLV